jgi:N-sulfoglucosamine sulfohydrolase
VDPDNVNNQAGDAKYAGEIERLSAALDEWQLKIYDSALLPESEMVKLSETAGKTIYEVVRDPELYDIKALQKASAVALEQDTSNLPKLYELLVSKDAGVRYWGVVGCFNLQGKAPLDKAAIAKLLSDDSHHVRAMAAWILYREGDKKAAQDCWNAMLAESSYASLKIFNIIDWIGEGKEPYAEAMKACAFSHNGYVARMQQYLGVAKAKPKEKKRKGKGK